MGIENERHVIRDGWIKIPNMYKCRYFMGFFLSIIYYFVFTIFFFVFFGGKMRKTSFSKMADTIACRFLCDAVDSISLMRVRYISRNCKYLFYIDISTVKIHYNYRYMLEQYEFYSSRFQFDHFFFVFLIKPFFPTFLFELF